MHYETILGTLLVVFIWAFIAGFVFHKIEPENAPAATAVNTGLIWMLLAALWPAWVYITWRDDKIAHVTRELTGEDQ